MQQDTQEASQRDVIKEAVTEGAEPEHQSAI